MQQRPWRPCTVDYAGIQGHVYTLLLESGNYYVGWSSAVEYRIAQHFSGAGSKWTMQHKPLQVLACVAGDTRLEDIVTISLMSKFGWERVRGGRWCQLALEGPPDAVMRAMAPQKPRPDRCNGHAAPDGGACSASRGTAQDGEPAPPQPGEQEVQGERETIAITARQSRWRPLRLARRSTEHASGARMRQARLQVYLCGFATRDHRAHLRVAAGALMEVRSLPRGQASRS